jgi:Rap1a immunity proteins
MGDVGFGQATTSPSLYVRQKYTPGIRSIASTVAKVNSVPKSQSPEHLARNWDRVLESFTMRQIAFIVAGLLFLVMCSTAGVLATGEEQVKISISDLTGNDLLRFCSSHEAFETNMCTGYIEGVRDGLMFATVSLKSKPFFSVPNKVSSDQLRDVVVKYLRDNPETRHKPAGMLTIFALKEAFPPEG